MGLVGFIVDAAIYNLLVFAGGHGPMFTQPMLAKCISLTISLLVSYIGNKLFTYRDRATPLSAREIGRFVIANVGAVALHLGCLGFSRFVLGLDSIVADNIWGTVVGQAVATVFRYVTYSKWVYVDARST